jgi:hypothetical protein
MRADYKKATVPKCTENRAAFFLLIIFSFPVPGKAQREFDSSELRLAKAMN